MPAVWDAPVIYRKRIVDAHVDLTGKWVLLSCFDGCVIELWRRPVDGQYAHVDGCAFDDCELVGDGWPAGLVDARR